MAGYGKWIAVVGGAIAAIGQFRGVEYYLPVIGGIVAIIGGVMSK
jgi:hypothetical protein